ncbi:MAG TPA: aminoglycoside phosphotransferase family protein [Roseiflexaceae bacterium]|nr:aminoglycoside phosphotransferase family protein [Roseiflexaceae bacterium]
MLIPPDISEDTIVARVRECYDLPVERAEFLPLGNDSSAWVYRARAAGGGDYFLKLRRGALNEPGLLVPRLLAEGGVPHVLAPLPTAEGGAWAQLEDFALIVYPFVEGQRGREAGMGERHWRALGEALRLIHAAELPPALAAAMRRESFAPDHHEVGRLLDRRIAHESFADPLEQELAAFWREHAGRIRALLDRSQEQGEHLRAASPPQVLCHADIHPWNVMIDRDGELWIVDWDEARLAPRERDLMFAIGGIGGDGVGPQTAAWFLQGYGPEPVDQQALRYYRCAWAVQDIASFAQEVFLMPDLAVEDRAAAVRFFKGLFTPGAIVEIAEG